MSIWPWITWKSWQSNAALQSKLKYVITVSLKKYFYKIFKRMPGLLVCWNKREGQLVEKHTTLSSCLKSSENLLFFSLIYFPNRCLLLKEHTFVGT